ncbi:MAG: META domain-containing protein [Gilvibacter sp.]
MKIFAICMLLFGLSCNGSKNLTKQEAMTELAGIYNVTAMGSENVSGSSMTLKFDPETAAVGGSSSCNKIFGSYSAEGETMSFSAMGMTKMYCEGKMQMEKDFMQALQAVNKYRIKGDQIELLQDKTVLLTLSK